MTKDTNKPNKPNKPSGTRSISDGYGKAKEGRNIVINDECCQENSGSGVKSPSITQFSATPPRPTK